MRTLSQPGLGSRLCAPMVTRVATAAVHNRNGRSARAMAEAGNDGDEMIEEPERVGPCGKRHVPLERRAPQFARRGLLGVEHPLAGDRPEQDGERSEGAPPVEPRL